MNEDLMSAAAKFIPVALRILSARALTFCALSAAMVLFGIAVYQATPLSLGIAATYCALVFLPVLVKDAKTA